MADNTQLNVGTAGDLIRSVDKLGKKTQVVTLDLGGAGVEALTAGTLPVSGSVSVANFPASQTVALDTASLAALEIISVANFPATQTINGSVSVSNFPTDAALTDIQLRATPVPVSGSFFQATQPVSIAAPVAVTGTFFQATQPVSIAASVAVTGPLTDTQIRATALPVSGAFFQATQPVSATSLPLPTGASSESTLAALNTKVTAVNTGAVTISAALPTGANTIGAISNTGFNVTGNGATSTVNSTTTNLAANGAFTGAGEDVSEYSTIMVTVFASHASATDGLQVQQSSDGTNWDLSDAYSIPATTGKTFSVGVQAKFYRVVYTNGATATTTLRLQTLYSKTAKKFSSVRPQDGRTNDNDFEEILSYAMVYDSAANTWHRMRGNSTTGVQISKTASVSLTTLSVANTTVTLTLPAVAGQFHYITRIRITAHNTTATAVAGSAVTLAFTSTNIPTSLAWTAGNALGAGVDKIIVDEVLDSPIKSTTVNTVTTIVAPACGTGVLVRITAYYYTAA